MLLFSHLVFDVDGGPLRPESFSLTWTNANPDLHVAQGGSPDVVGVNSSHNPMICVFISEAIAVGEWTLLEGDVMNGDGVINTVRLQFAHFPLDINADGRIDVRDATKFGRAFRRYDPPINLIDLNRDNRVDARDATFFGVLWRGEQSFNEHRLHTLGPMIPLLDGVDVGRPDEWGRLPGVGASPRKRGVSRDDPMTGILDTDLLGQEGHVLSYGLMWSF